VTSCPAGALAFVTRVGSTAVDTISFTVVVP
jgi:hypothetical protein